MGTIVRIETDNFIDVLPKKEMGFSEMSQKTFLESHKKSQKVTKKIFFHLLDTLDSH